MAQAKSIQQRELGSRSVVVIPTYNEAENIRRLIPAIMDYAAFDVLVVDDGSPDGTADVVQTCAGAFPGRVHLLNRARKLGLGTAYVAGFSWALQRDYTHIFEMDADFSHHPATLPRLLAASEQADLVLGSRYVRGGRTINWPWHRKLISRGGSIYARRLLGVGFQDLTGGFKCFRRQVLEALDLDAISSTGYAFQIELTYRAWQHGFRIVEVPITFAERTVGTSKMDRAIVGEAVLRVLQLRRQDRQAGQRPAPTRTFLPQPVALPRKRPAK